MRECHQILIKTSQKLIVLIYKHLMHWRCMIGVLMHIIINHLIYLSSKIFIQKLFWPNIILGSFVASGKLVELSQCAQARP